MENMQRPHCAKNGKCMRVGRCKKDILSSMKGMMKDYPAFELEQLRSLRWLKVEVFSLLKGPLGEGAPRGLTEEGRQPPPQIQGGSAMETQSWGACGGARPKELEGPCSHVLTQADCAQHFTVYKLLSLVSP